MMMFANVEIKIHDLVLVDNPKRVVETMGIAEPEKVERDLTAPVLVTGMKISGTEDQILIVNPVGQKYVEYEIPLRYIGVHWVHGTNV